MSSERRKLSKSELREDEFVEWIMEAVEYVKERARLFVGGAVAVIAVIVAINYFIESKETDRLNAAALLGDVLMVEQGGEQTEVVRLAEELVSAYAGTPAAAQGTIILANLYYAQGRYVEARTYYQRYLDNYEPLDVLAYAAQSGLGACLEAEGQFVAAAQHYETYAAQQAGTIREAMAQMEAARIYGLAGESGKQQTLLEQVSRTFVQYPIAAQARAALAMF
ncbi:MAG: tetratricopeptide repeat protein [Gemmatimonadetes bacterium]|nr:tetratricopeptide repeat protein [Gemmatimonadota bacterium]MYC70538.1 tetratricopeptide repeat protein [Gemmatimonadota bacterium]MYI63672.1 tetratricopeptide repeat protein [Gemmatimonadota bacterium]